MGASPLLTSFPRREVENVRGGFWDLSVRADEQNRSLHLASGGVRSLVVSKWSDDLEGLSADQRMPGGRSLDGVADVRI